MQNTFLDMMVKYIQPMGNFPKKEIMYRFLGHILRTQIISILLIAAFLIEKIAIYKQDSNIDLAYEKFSQIGNSVWN